MSEEDSDLPKGWKGPKESKSNPGKFYYYNPHTKEKSWHRPTQESHGGGGGTKRPHDESSSSTSPNKKAKLEEVQCLHLLRKHKDSRRPSSWRENEITCTKEEAAIKVEEFRQIILEEAGEKSIEELQEVFEELAKSESDCSSAKRGGDLGTFGRGKMQKPFEEASFVLKIGELSQVIHTDSGKGEVFVLLKVYKFFFFRCSYYITSKIVM